MKKFFVILTLPLTLHCVSYAQTASDHANPHSSAKTQNLPLVYLTEEILFKYLSAELAEQRGNSFAAYSTMMTIARSSRDPRIARRAAEMAMNSKLTVEAVKATQFWAEVDPTSEEAAQVLLSLLLITNQTDEAKKILAKRLANSNAANLGSVIAQTQRHLARIPDRARAASLLKELLEPYRNSVEAQVAIAKSALDAGKASDAMKESRDVVSKNPQSELAVLSLIQLMEDKNEALKVLADFLQKNPKSRDIRLTYARLLLELGKVAEAKKEFKTLLQQVPQEQTSLYAMGLLAAQSGEFTEAENYLAAYIKTLNGNRDPERDSSQALMVLAQIAEDKNDLPTAVKWLEQVDSNAQNNFLTAVIKRAHIKAKAGQLAEARQLLAQISTENDEDKIKLLIGEAQLLRDTGKLNESLQFIEEALQRFTDNTDLLYEYAMVAEKNNQLDLMEQSLRKIITLTPNSPHAYNALGYMLADRNVRLKEAHELISKAVALAPDDAYILDSMGWVEFRMGQLDKAEEILRRAYGIKPDSEIAAHLGEVLWTKGRNDEAKKLWRAAASKDPKNETLKNTLKRLRIKL